ncbi:hypothetical protein T484DRAFT_1984223 [Baffinella frigidus]|nr:hypothetical protein T484DRAFT_1984223 [Cryptophyta sp. CCMP2293]|mmetsp:Transcript_64658/g.154365  ORF Transcript_64658/g.154365 Transcript_64658/m.154365 type:complete len:451 (+) Transcript_64658:262-1614(+)
MQNNFPHHPLQMGQYGGAGVAQPHPDLMAAFADRGRPPQVPFNGAVHHAHYGALGMAAPGGAQQHSNLQPAYAHSPRLPIELEQQAPAKRQRPGGGGSVPEDALMELARENLVLKHQLHLATMEAQRLSSIIEGFSQSKPAPRQQPSPGSQTRYWSDEEHQKFLEGVNKFGAKDVRAISFVVGTRTATQVRSHAQKFFMKLASQNKSSDQDTRGNPDRDPNIPIASIMRGPSSAQSAEVAAATVAAGGEGGTSAAAAAAFVAAHSKMTVDNMEVMREGVRNGSSGIKRDSSGQNHTRGRGGGSGTPDSSGCSAAARSSAATAQHGASGSGSGASSSGSGGPAGDSGEASNNASNDGESASDNGSNSHEGAEQGFFGSMEQADDDLSGEDYAYSFPMAAQGFAVARGEFGSKASPGSASSSSSVAALANKAAEQRKAADRAAMCKGEETPL